ncbi:hypothetical protein LTR85_002790 [Meristemomyces frigidus]|nr:hypothetical protein LTR85_002790 [Meristemomyces frigidus]
MSSRVFAPIKRALSPARLFHRSSMDALVRDSIRLVEAKKKGDVSWEVDKPSNQSYYSWRDGKWQASDPSSTDSQETSGGKSEVKSLALYSWNIDFMLPFPDSRMRAAICHLESEHIAKQDPSFATVIFLNECLQSDLKLIAKDPWVRQTFQITDIDGTNWQSGHYGTMTLIDKRLPIESCFRVHYSKTRMERDGLFVDIALGTPGKPIRLCNTHLESLAFEPPFRPPQLALCASYMHDNKAIHGAILAGDLNAIQDFDKHLHTDKHLKDAYLELGGREDDAEGGHTWGQQAATVQRERFGTCRMDKVLYCGGVQCKTFEHFGAGIEVEEEGEREGIVKLGFDKPWITDHLGVKAVFELADIA